MKRKTNITRALNNLDKKDIYSMMLFTLYKMKDIPDYLTLTQLCYTLDNGNLIKFLSFFGGMTITVPRLEDLRLMAQTLLLYQYVVIEGKPFQDSLDAVVTAEFDAKTIKETYEQMVKVMEDYNFEQR